MLACGGLGDPTLRWPGRGQLGDTGGRAAPPNRSPVGAVPDALELVEDAVVLIERAELAPQVVVNLPARRDG